MTETPPLPPRELLLNRQLNYLERVNLKVTEPRQCWVDNFDAIEFSEKRGLLELHPRVFGAFPRPDIIEENIKWQKMYRRIDWLCLKTRAEFDTGNAKPWAQKGTGRARHGSTRAPQWHEGGWSHGPRGPKSWFYMLEYFLRVRGLICTLSAKFAQNDIKFVDSLENFPSDDPAELEKFMDTRGWGPSALIVDKSDIFPRNIALAAENVKHINLMPVYGLNCFSMLKHETLILTVAAMEDIEEKLLFQLERTDLTELNKKWVPREVGEPHNI
ncbi:39S ribosomal protein L4, mitochondrial [Halotydeus destructor]|nr:39S ribosomal protein L4, mitochondrial [Halotydeus destructor]